MKEGPGVLPLKRNCLDISQWNLLSPAIFLRGGYPGSPSNSPTAARKQANISRAQSLELVSSDDGENKDDGRSRNGEISLFTYMYDFVYVYRNTQQSSFLHL